MRIGRCQLITSRLSVKQLWWMVGERVSNSLGVAANKLEIPRASANNEEIEDGMLDPRDGVPDVTR